MTQDERLIGKRHLESALAQLRAQTPGLAVEVEWRLQPLIPGTPADGIPYRDFYVARLGSRRRCSPRAGSRARTGARDAPQPLAHDADWLPLLPLPRYGGAAVTCFVFDETHALSGAVPPGILLQAMHAVLAV